MPDDLIQEVFEANLMLPKLGLVSFTWGNASGVDRARGLVVIKPSGVSYDELKPESMVVLDLETGKVVAGALRPSSDTATHLALYRAWGEIGGIVHTHSTYATTWAQAGRGIPCYGTTHADTFYGGVPCTRDLTEAEVEAAYEANTGAVIAETFAARGLNPMHTPAVLCKNHGPFTWGATATAAAEHAAVLEEVAHMALLTAQLNPDAPEAPAYVQAKHFLRKHGPGAYYGQG